MDLRYFVIVAAIAAGLECSRILVIYPTISISHVMPLQSMAVALATKGHDITFVSAYPLGKEVKNYREVKVPFEDSEKAFISKAFEDNAGMGVGMFIEMLSLLIRLGNDTLQMTEMRRMMNEEKFDLVIVGYFFTTESMVGLAAHFDCPSILFSPATAFPPITSALGNPTGFSDPSFPVEMNFINRVKFFLFHGVGTVGMEYFKYRAKKVHDFNFPADRYRSFDESLRNVSLALVNTHFSAGFPRPLLPNLVEVGGIQVKPKPSPLPKDLKTFLDGAEDGAVFFSLGSNAKSTFLSKTTIKTLLAVFAQLKHRVIMKWEAHTLEGKPENVFIGKWLPQDDILAHPNLKVFISHCGHGGIVESKYHGVPIVAMPLMADQFNNAQNVVSEGWGLQVDMKTLTEKALKDAILEILGNPKYATTVKRFSELSKDRPMNAQDTAVYWVEYVLRHRGAPHLHYQGADLNFLQYNSLDVIAFLIAIVYVAIKLLKIVCKKLCCGWRKSKAAPASSGKKQKKN